MNIQESIRRILKEETNFPLVISKQVDDTVYGVIEDMITFKYGEITVEKDFKDGRNTNMVILYDSEGNEIGDISKAYYDRNPEHHTLWIEEPIDSDKFVDDLTRYIPFDRIVRGDYVKKYFGWKYGDGRNILFINSRY